MDEPLFRARPVALRLVFLQKGFSERGFLKTEVREEGVAASIDAELTGIRGGLSRPFPDLYLVPRALGPAEAAAGASPDAAEEVAFHPLAAR
ncbi:MAG: hypothetical protein AAF725_14965 [Acidobacteriota bacterium]